MGCGTLAALALTGAGAGTQLYAQNKAQGAMEDATQSELRRQREYQTKADQVFRQGLRQSESGTAEQQIAQGQKQALDATRSASLPRLALPTTTNRPGQTTGNQANVSYVGQDARNTMGSLANANLKGYGNYGVQQGLGNMDINNRLGVINNMSQRSQAVLPFELEQARNSQAMLQSLGSLLGTAGMLTGIGSMVAAPAGATASQSANVLNEFNGIGQAGMAGSGAGFATPYGAAMFAPPMKYIPRVYGPM